MLLGGIFKLTGNRTPVSVAAKSKWFFEDIERFVIQYDIRFQKNPHFIINSLTMMRGAIWAANTGVLDRYNKAMFEATWVHGLDTANPQVIADVVSQAGLSAAAMAQAVTDSAVKQQLISATQSAVDRKVFGVPTMMVNNELHFGQDRLDWVERALRSG